MKFLNINGSFIRLMKTNGCEWWEGIWSGSLL